MEDLDDLHVQREVKRGFLSQSLTLPRQLFVQALECAANANDTTRMQERAMRDQLARTR